MSRRHDDVHDEAPLPTRRDRFERFATLVGDLDSPFYDEERDRDVWNEASAVGYQLLLWGVPIAATLCLWIGRSAALGPVAIMLVPWVAANVTTLTYARRRAVDPGQSGLRVASPTRLALLGVLLAALGASFLRAVPPVAGDSEWASFLRGMAQGAGATFAVIALASAGVAVWETRRRRNQEA